MAGIRSWSTAEGETSVTEDRRVDITTVAADFLNLSFPDGWAREEMPGVGIYNIDENQVDQLTCEILNLIANIIASILNAGSERDAVNEDEELYTAIKTHLLGWTREG